MRLAIYQPDIPQNLGTMLRLCACMNLGVDIIEPCGFPWNDTKLRRAGMDYIDYVSFKRHVSWQAYTHFLEESFPQHRRVLLTTKAAEPYTQFHFQAEDVLLVGRESAGVPEEVHEDCHHRLTIPMQPPLRSLNVAIAASMVIGEALRQLHIS